MTSDVIKNQKNVVRWTDGVLLHSKKEHMFFEARPSQADIQPLYSSFNPKGIFKPPPSSKESLARQKQREIEDKPLTEKVNLSQEVENNTDEKLKEHTTKSQRLIKTAFGGRREARSLFNSNRSNYAQTKGTANNYCMFILILFLKIYQTLIFILLTLSNFIYSWLETKKPKSRI